MTITIEQAVLERLKELPLHKQLEVLEFTESLRKQAVNPGPPLRSLEGILADLNVHITEEDIAEARREMWGNFPRDIDL